MAEMNTDSSGGHNRGSSVIISIESTADGDIQTVEEETTTTAFGGAPLVNQDDDDEYEASRNSESFKAFTHHLRDSWDDGFEVDGPNAGSPPRGSAVATTTTRHKQNLSVQFLDFSISEAGDNDAGDGGAGRAAAAPHHEPPTSGRARGGSSEAEAIESAAAYYFDPPAPEEPNPPVDESERSGGAAEEVADCDKANFTNNIRNSWGFAAEGSGGGQQQAQSSWHRKAASSVQFLDSTILEYVKDLPVDKQGVNTEEVVVPTKAEAVAPVGAALAEVFEPPQPSEPEPEQQRRRQHHRRLGNDSPLSPHSAAEKNDIVVPIPLRPTATGISRKHRRVFSGRSNPAMVHRRVNTRGDKCAPGTEFKVEEGPDGSTGGVGGDSAGPPPFPPARDGDEAATTARARRRVESAMVSAPPPPQPPPPSSFTMPSYEQPLSPATEAMPPPLPPRQAPTQPPLPPPPAPPQYPHYYHGTPPPSYDPYNPPYGSQQHAAPPPPHPHYAYGTPPPPPAYYSASPQSDAGVSYGVHQTSPVVSGYPHPSVPPQQQASPRHDQHLLSTQSAPAGYYADGAASRNGSYIAQQPPLHNLNQPTLEEDHPLSPRSQRVDERIYTDEKLFAKGTIGGGSGGGNHGHKKEPSFNPLPYNDTGNGIHHRKQSSLGSFLATTALFDDDLFDEDEGYASAPEEGDSDKRSSHNKTLSSASFMRSLSSDNFLRDLNDDEAKQFAVAAGISPQRQQRAPPQAPPQMPSTGDGYRIHSTSPVVSSATSPAPPQPPPPPGTTPGYPPTPPGYYHYGTPPPMWSPQSQTGMYPPPPQQQVPYPHQSPYQHPQPYDMPPQSNAASPGVYPQAPHQQPICTQVPSNAAGGAPFAADDPKRSRRKCSVPDCPNRVVQGGLCIAHGAKRKTCAHPGCTKNVKKAGMCSAHGPARKRCEFEGCTKVAVQGGRCIAHGAKKKVCAMDECSKQAILGGYCKKHYDQVHGVIKVRAPRKKTGAKQHDLSLAGANSLDSDEHQSGHERGLSLLQDSDLMESIINNGAPGTPPVDDDSDGLHGLSI